MFHLNKIRMMVEVSFQISLTTHYTAQFDDQEDIIPARCEM